MGETELLITIIVFNLFFVVFVVLVMIYVKRYKQRKQEYQNEIKINQEIHQKELLATQLEIKQATMQEIGRELHDNIGQKLTLVSLYTQQITHENLAPEINDRIQQTYEIINETLQELRALSKTLTDDKINSAEIVDLIQNEVAKTNQLKKCEIQFEHNFDKIQLDFVEKNVILRVIQEFIQNSMKHSNCKTIKIQLETDKEFHLKLMITDDGKGFDMKTLQSTGIGLRNMKKRTELIGGTFHLDSIQNRGTTLIITINQKP